MKYIPQQQYVSPQFQQGYSNPALKSQINRLNQMQGGYPQYPQAYPQPQQPIQPQPQGNMIRTVTSIDEIKAITPNFDGSKMYFEDVTNGKLYVKYLGLNGLPITEIYGKEEIPVVAENTTTQVNASDFVSRTEFEEMKAKINQYEMIFNELIGGAKNVKSTSDNATC